MSALRYLLVIALVGVLALLTVADHVERTRLGYDLRALEERRGRLLEEEKAARLAYERAAIPEKLMVRAEALGVARRADLLALAGRREVPAPGGR